MAIPRPVIGDFRGADQNKPRAAPQPPPEEKAETPVDPSTQGEGDTTLKTADFLTPAERYRKILLDYKIDIKQAEAIYDSVLSKGYYEEYIRIRGNNRAILRTRMYEDHLRLQTVLEMEKPQLALSQDELITRYNLAASLWEWNGNKLEHGTDENFDKIMDLIKKLPGPLFSVIARELSKFDAKIMAVFSEGAEENF